MKVESMFYIALGAAVDSIAKRDAYAEYASTEDNKYFRGLYTRRALKYRTMAIVEFDREMDRLVKEYK